MKQVFWTLMIVCGASLVFAAETPRLYRVQQDGKAGFIDARGQIVIPINLPEGTGEFSEGLAPTRGGFGCDYIDETGRMLKIARKFHAVQEFSEGLGAVLNRSHMGYIDRRGKVVIPAQFLLAEPWCQHQRWTPPRLLAAGLGIEINPDYVAALGRLHFSTSRPTEAPQSVSA
jgi:hypothetical protein